MGNPFVHVELNTTDIEKAKSFYSQMFDWEMEDMNMGPSEKFQNVDLAIARSTNH